MWINKPQDKPTNDQSPVFNLNPLSSPRHAILRLCKEKGLWNKISPYEDGVWRRVAGDASEVSLEAVQLLTRVNVEVLVERVPED